MVEQALADIHEQANHELVINRGSETILTSPTAMPKASSFLWNSKMMIHMNCRGYASAQFMQPEPAKYARGPAIEATGFMQPEQGYYAHHPGRFFYIKDQHSQQLFSAPYEPTRVAFDSFKFIVATDHIRWLLNKNGLEISISLSLTENDSIELWQIDLKNITDKKQNYSLTPYFPVGYMSWMNQSAAFDQELNALVCRSITPYQKINDYFKNQQLKDLTFLLADRRPQSWEASQEVFEGEGGLQAPSALNGATLTNSEALYETPTAALQYPLELEAGDSQTFKFIFGAASNCDAIRSIKKQYFESKTSFSEAHYQYARYISSGTGAVKVSTPDQSFDHFVNNWLDRQIFYHGDVNRLSTDPQTRNYLQDAMGMSYITPSIARTAFVNALSQQKQSGVMPDGILLSDEAELKYINQIPHMDHCVWLAICISAYLDETADYAFLNQEIAFADHSGTASVAEHIDLALQWLFEQRDQRGLNYIAQGDWCDPMNMVGYKGKGVSAWLTLANAYACKVWAKVCLDVERLVPSKQFSRMSEQLNSDVNKHLWYQQWYARGITDDGRLFGIDKNQEGQIFLNPQSWAMLSGAANQQRCDRLKKHIRERLEGPYGVELLAPAYTSMREDIGRVTQKFPGSAENGSVYNHASTFYIYALYQCGDGENAFRLLRNMLPGPNIEDLCRRGQLPVFMPNYYRGARRQFPHVAGRSSQLFNTGSVHWLYRSLIEGLFGAKGCREGLKIAPQFPNDWQTASIERKFRGATLTIDYQRSDITKQCISVDGKSVTGDTIKQIRAGKRYHVCVKIPTL